MLGRTLGLGLLELDLEIGTVYERGAKWSTEAVGTAERSGAQNTVFMCSCCIYRGRAYVHAETGEIQRGHVIENNYVAKTMDALLLDTTPRVRKRTPGNIAIIGRYSCLLAVFFFFRALLLVVPTVLVFLFIYLIVWRIPLKTTHSVFTSAELFKCQ